MTELKQTAMATAIALILFLLSIVGMKIHPEIQAELFILSMLLLIIFICFCFKLLVEVIKNRLDL